MSTIADRMAAAFKEVAGLSFVPSDDRRLRVGDYGSSRWCRSHDPQ